MNNLQSLSELQPQIIEWARKRNILFPENAPKQRLKLIEECGELASAILKNDVKLKKDAIGDIFVVIVILNEQTQERNGKFADDDKLTINDSIDELLQRLCFSTLKTGTSYDKGWNMANQYLVMLSISLNLNLTECANIAWNEIKDRTGKTVNGTFIKD